MKLTSQISSSTSLIPTACPARQVLRFFLATAKTSLVLLYAP